MLSRLFEDVRALEARIAEVTAEIEDIAAADDTTRRLMTIPGIGPLAATGLLAKSFSSASSPIFACSVFTSIAGAVASNFASEPKHRQPLQEAGCATA